ncbi:MAG: polyhydroxyalkanoate synthesis repressor PhaR, partial [Pseudomonadota bacterium]
MLKKPDVEKADTDNVVIKKYANRRLYNTETSTYVTLDDLAEMVRGDRDFTVFDAKSGDDLTHSVLTQIIVDQESKGQTLLPIPFLRQLIRFYDDGIARMVPTYLQFSLEALVKEQEKYRSQFANAFGPTAAFEAYQEQARRNMAIFEQAMSLWTPFHGSGNKPGEDGGVGGAQPGTAGDASMSPGAPDGPATAPPPSTAPAASSTSSAPTGQKAASAGASSDELGEL